MKTLPGSIILFAGAVVLLLITWLPIQAAAQSISSGTVEGTVTDPSGDVVKGAKVEIRNPVTGYRQTTTSDAAGMFRFSNVPFNNYHVAVEQPGFSPNEQDVNVRAAVTVSIKAALAVAGVQQSVKVEAGGADIVENIPSAHVDVDRTTIERLPVASPASGLSDAIMLSSPGVAADSNGFFHPLGDHAQTSFSIDGQPISDQQSKAFSTQIPANAIQSMELVTGTPNAEFGDKTSLIVNAVTRSGLGQLRPTGAFITNYGSFGTVSVEMSFGAGTATVGYFGAANLVRSRRFLDTPEFNALHALGNNMDMFHRLDFRLTDKDALHFNVFFARNSFQVPITLDQPGQDQRQKVVTFNFAPAYQHIFNTKTLLTVNPFVRQDRVNYYPSSDTSQDTPATLSQQRRLTNYGVKSDVTYVAGQHNLKIGGQLMQTRLRENFSIAITDPLFNAVCVDAGGSPQELPAVQDPADCTGAGPGITANPDFLPGVLPLDLTRGGAPFQFAGAGNINEYAFYVQDAITAGRFTLTPGLRIDRYDGFAKKTSVQPRGGISVLLGGATVLRAGYARTMETPYNENLLLSNTTGNSGLTDLAGGTSTPMQPGNRHQFDVGFEQGIGKYIQVQADYFWKFTDNAFDFGVILNTPIEFPISWTKSKLDGFAVRVSTTDIRGFQAYTNIGHTRARYFAPENGGLLFDSPLNTSVFRIDHDQAFQQTTNFRYQLPRKGWYGSVTWRYDSGLVAGAVGSLDDALALTGAEQAAIGFYCGTTYATPDSPITSCASPTFGATRLKIPPEGTENDDHNPPRIAPRHIFDIGVGTDDLFRAGDGRVRTTVRLSVSNLTNRIALYNFLSTFSGTHFVAPRTWSGSIGVAF